MEKARQYTALGLALAAALVSTAAWAQEARLGWALAMKDDRLVLWHGKPETDDIQIEISCRPGTPGLTVWAPVGDEPALRLGSGGLVHTYVSDIQEDLENDGGDRVAHATANDAVLMAFAKSGSLRLNDRPDYGASKAERKTIKAFFKSCRRKPLGR